MRTVDGFETTREVVESKDGVMVKVKSKRGCGTRDQDTVTVKAHYDDLQEAQENDARLNFALYKQLDNARKNDPGNDRED